ncbi:hypothetical protein [Neorhizobium tomejilense]|uniref:hypothetical protein n=1 Tax=Neorhizobium tomejilense TaxID=2093828 RepID=UPI003ECFB88A
MKTFNSLLQLAVTVTVFTLIISSFMRIELFPEWIDDILNDLINLYVGYTFAHLVIRWRCKRAAKREAMA